MLFKLKEIDKVVPKTGSIHTAFGNAVHLICERYLKDNFSEPYEIFLGEFRKRMEEIPEMKALLAIPDNRKLITEMLSQAKELFPEIVPATQRFFNEFKVLSTECQLMEPMQGTALKFKGFVDLVLYTEKEDTFHIIDWKTCSWGWDARKKADKVLGYQLALYKHFFCQMNNIPPEKAETYFALLKRVAKPGKKVEIFRTTSGKVKLKNALEWIDTPVKNIEKGFFPKRSLYCAQCPGKGVCK
jgi:ATP-dependent exoDNAse (exonuclease V) beta subunit